MLKIVDVHYPNIKKDLLSAALRIFYEVRNMPGIKKKPSTSEFIDWLKLLMADDIPSELLQSKEQMSAIPPLQGALLKNEQDIRLFERLMMMNKNHR
jgi:MoxR-like ATPase